MIEYIFFYANFRTYDFTLGITRKVFSEIASFRKIGYKVYYSGYLKDGVAIFDNESNIVLKKKYPFKNESLIHIIRRPMLINLCIDYMKKCDLNFSFSYVRYHFFDRKYLKLLSSLNLKSDKVIIEAHSAPKFPKDFSIMRCVGWKDSRWNKLAKKYVDLVASMSDEERLWGIDTVKITNGIDVKAIRKHKYSGDKNKINLIAVSFESPVHGYDRIIRGIREYYDNGGKRKITFHIVGTTMRQTDNLISDLGLSDICIKYGPKVGEELDDIYDKANIGIGCLANHRIGSKFGSALKTKEYIAKGIPFVYGWQEAVLEGFEFALKFELCEAPIDIEKIIIFFDNLPKDGLSSTIRGHLSYKDTWDYQIKRVVDAIKEKA